MSTQRPVVIVMVEDDVLLAYVNGPWLLAELTEFLSLCEQTFARLGSVYLVTIVGPGYGLPPDSRKYIAEWGRGHTVTGNVIENAPSFGIVSGWGKYMRDVTISGNVIKLTAPERSVTTIELLGTTP